MSVDLSKARPGDICVLRNEERVVFKGAFPNETFPYEAGGATYTRNGSVWCCETDIVEVIPASPEPDPEPVSATQCQPESVRDQIVVSPCQCDNWCEIDHTHRFLTGHHEGCPHSPKALDKALELIADLARGMELWGAEEDGIYPEAWEAYRKAKVLQGVFIPPANAGLRHAERM